MEFLTDNETGSLYIRDDDGQDWEVLQDEDGDYVVEDEDGTRYEVDADEVEAALSGEGWEYEDAEGEYGESDNPAQDAWDSWADLQLQQLDKKLGRRLTSNEVSKLYDRANNHHEPTPDFGKIFDEEFPGRREQRDADSRREVIREIAEDTHREQRENEPEPEEAEESNTAESRREQIAEAVEDSNAEAVGVEGDE
jgi:hypothetical protein